MKLAAFTAAALAIASPAFAEPDCTGLERKLAHHLSEYGERVVWSGAEDEGKYIIVVMADDGAWSILRSDGETACLVHYGLHSVVMPRGNV